MVQSVTVTGTVETSVISTIGGSVHIEGTPTVEIVGTPEVLAVGTPDVHVTSGTIDTHITTGTVEAHGTVEIKGTPEVLAVGTPDVRVTSGTMEIGGTVIARGRSNNVGTTDNVGVVSTATLLLDGNQNRVSALLKNIGGTPIYIGFESSLAAGTDFKLDDGEGWEINQTNLYLGSVYGINSAGAGTINVSRIHY